MQTNMFIKILHGKDDPTEEERLSKCCLRYTRQDSFNEYYEIVSNTINLSEAQIISALGCFGGRREGTEIAIYKD